MPLSLGNSTLIKHKVSNPELVPSHVNDATVTVTILDKAGVEIPDEVWPVALPYVSGSDGVYSKTFEPFDSLVEKEIYTVRINVIGADTLEYECETSTRATKRSC